MTEGLDSRFASVVAGRWPAWLRSAYLLTGSESVAEQLVTASLVSARRRWRQLEADGDPAGAVHAEMCRLHVARFRARFIGPAGEPGGDAPSDPVQLRRFRQDRVWAGLRDLTAPARAVVVLTHLERADLPQVGALLGCSVRTAAIRLERGLADLRTATPSGTGGAATTAEAVELLSAAATERLGALHEQGDPLADVRAAVRSDRVRRGAVVATVVAGCLVVGSAGLWVDGRRSLPPGEPDPGSPSVVRTVTLSGVVWPVAGSLTSDPAALADLEAALGRSSAASGAYRPRVVFAGDLEARRVVLATDGLGHAWFLHGPPGAPVRILDGYGAPTPTETLDGPLSVLLPRPGPDADLLVVTPETLHVQVADWPAVWPMQQAPYRAVDVDAGVRLTRLEARTPFALSAMTVSIRGISGTGPSPGIVFEVDDVDPVVHDHSDTSALAQEYTGQLAGTVVDASATAVAVAGFGAGPTDLSVAATTTGGCPGRSCRITAAVVEAVAADIRSRTLAVHAGMTAGGGATPLGIAGSDTAPVSDAGLPDHRPRVVAFMPQIEDQPVGTMVWADSPGGRIHYTYGSGADRRTAVARLDRHGFVWLSVWEDVRVTSVADRDGFPRWHEQRQAQR